MNAGAALLAPASITLACLVAEQGLARSAPVRRILANPGDFARLLMGAVLLAGVLAALARSLLPGLDPGLGIATAQFIALAASLAMLHRRHAADVRAAVVWLIIPLALSVLPLCVAGESPRVMLSGALVIAFALMIGLPALTVLLRRLGDSDVPAWMRPVPVRLLVSGLIVLALAGSLSW